MKANHLQRSGHIMSVSANRAWIGGPITDSGDPTQLGMGAGWQMAGNGTGLRPVIPDRTTFVGSGTMSKTIACCNDEPAPHSIFDVQLGARSVKDLAAPRDTARRTSVPGWPDLTTPSGRHASSWNRQPQDWPAMCARSRTHQDQDQVLRHIQHACEA